mgnify:CR=1 FL=1
MWWSLGVVLVARVGFSTLLSSILLSELSYGHSRGVHVRAETTRVINYTNYPLLFFPFSCPLIYSAHFDVSHGIWALGDVTPLIPSTHATAGFGALRAPALSTQKITFLIRFFCA